MTPYEIEVEANKIMARIQEPKRNRFSLKMSVAIGLLLIGLFIPGLLQNDETFTVSKVSANEYLINLFGDEMKFYIYGLVENEDTLAVNEKVTYFEDGVRYFDITDQLEVNPIIIDDYLFLEIAHEKKPIYYFYVLNYNENNRHVIALGNDFNNFKIEMQDTIDLVNQYPYEMTTEPNSVCLAFGSHKDAKNLTKKQQQAYEAFLDLQGSGCVESVVNSFAVEIHFNGTADAIGNIDTPPHYVLGGEEEHYKTVFPVTFDEGLGYPVILFSKEKGPNVQIQTYLYVFEESDHYANAAKIEFDGVNPEDYRVELYQKGVQLENLEIKKEGNTWYVMPVFINELFSSEELSQTYNINVENECLVKVVHKKTNAVLFEYIDYMSY